jgi:hypothetical protein
MEDLMLGTKRTVPFWRPKKRLLNVARAVTGDGKDTAKGAATAQAIAGARARDRIATESKKKARFAER